MPETFITGVVVFDERLFHGRGAVNVWAEKVALKFVTKTIEHCPVREGDLAASIGHDLHHPGSHLIEMAVGVGGPEAPYAGFVLRGTGYGGKGKAGWIYSTKGFITRNPDDAFVPLWGRRGAGGRFTRLGRGQRQRMLVRKRGYWLGLKPDGPIKFRVHGQKANNFMLSGYRATRRSHRALPLPPPGLLHP